MAQKKVYTLRKTRMFFGSRPTEERDITGTLEELTEHFSYTLLVGHSYKKAIPQHPKTIASLVSALNRAYDIKDGGMTSVELKK